MSKKSKKKEQAPVNDIRIYQYNPCWVETYEKQVKRLQERLPKRIKARFMHVGSTAVPGCYTSGDMDIAHGIESPLDLITVRDVLLVNGYKYDQKHSALHHYVVTRAINGTLTVIVHIVCIGNPIWEDMYIFKDHLLRHNDVRDKYSDLRFQMTKIPNLSLDDYELEKRKFQKEIIRKLK